MCVFSSSSYHQYDQRVAALSICCAHLRDAECGGGGLSDVIRVQQSGPNSVKTILGLNVQGGNSVKSMLFYPGFVEQKPILKYEYNYYLNMVFVRQNQGRTIPWTLNPRIYSHPGRFLRYLLHSRMGFFVKKPAWLDFSLCINQKHLVYVINT